jgi:prepilin-type N-terminal cleavage/methylation domain-containing protein
VADRSSRRHASEQGFTLVELLMVVLITSIIGGAIVGVVLSVSRAERVALDVSNNLDSARIAVERVRDVVRASYAICDDSTDQMLHVWRDDADEDRRVDADELTELSVGGLQLRREDAGTPIRVLASGVGTSSFAYTDNTGTAVPPPLTGRAIDCTSPAEQADRGDITTVDISLSGDRAPGGRTPPTVVDSQITLRNAIIADGSIEPNRTPNASFKHTCSPPSCSFDATESHDEDGDIVSYSWEFGDGNTGSGVTESHVFATYGTYAVTLTVVDDGGAASSSTQFISVTTGNANPAASFTHSCSGLTCTFAGSGTDSDGTIAGYAWTFGDGDSSTAGDTVTHTYATAGAYSVTLTVTDNEGAIGSHSAIVNPNTSAGSVIVSLEDVSTAKNNNFYYARVQITVKNSDGSPAVGVNVSGRFGGETSPLVAQDTNAEGHALLQASGDYSVDTSVPFTVVEVKDRATSGTTYITLQHPG